MVSKHNLKGVAWKPLRHRLIGFSKSGQENLFQEEVDMLERLVEKMDDFQGDSISLDYLKPDCEQLAEEMMFPVPAWAQKEFLNTDDQTNEQGERVFEGSLPNLDILMKNLKISGRKRKRNWT